MSNQPLQKVDGIWAGYGTKTILHDISFAVEPGQFLSVIAPNGTGKSTLLRCISGVLPAKQGSLVVGGKAVSSFSRRELAKLSAVVGEEETAFDYTAYQTEAMGRFAHIGRFGSAGLEDRRIVQQSLIDVGMWDKRQHNLSRLSQGERQKVLIARALAQCPQVLLLDEPTSHLDIRNQFAILGLIKQLMVKSNTAVVAVIHDINLALQFSTHLLLMKDGEMLAYGQPADVLSEGTLRTMYGIDFVLHRNQQSLYVQPNFVEECR
jgi:iron complex transport system ATP-binding protein